MSMPRHATEDERAKASEAFRREVQVMRKIQHQNIVPFVGWLDEGGAIGIIMEKFDSTLFEVLKHRAVRADQGALAWFELAEVCDILQSIAAGLTFMHGMEISHRGTLKNWFAVVVSHFFPTTDLKSENVLCELGGIGDEVSRVVLSDFGTAAVAQAFDVSAGTVVGTLGTMAPEGLFSHV
jgi:serine/threonine protein kinase